MLTKRQKKTKSIKNKKTGVKKLIKTESELQHIQPVGSGDTIESTSQATSSISNSVTSAAWWSML